MKNWWGILGLAGFVAVPSLPAQNPKFDPPLGSVFPLERTSDGTRVLVSRPLLLNQATVLPAGTQLRTIYIPPQHGDADVKKNTQENLEATFTRKKIGPAANKDALTPLERAAYERAYETVWTDPMQFRTWLQRLDEHQLRLVFSLPDNTEITMQPLESFQGMVLDAGERGPHVLSVLVDSPAYKNGVKAGWTVLSVGGKETAGLEDFAAAFNEAFVQSKLNRQPFALSFKVPEEAQPRAIAFAPPRSLNSPTLFDKVEP